jgi:tetratricopeptide (TPR) repeat protein
MQWLELESHLRLPATVKISLLRTAIEGQPANILLRIKLGDALLETADYSGAAENYEVAARQSPRDFDSWPNLAGCYLSLNNPDAALDACRRGEANGPTATIHFARAHAFLLQGRGEDARAAFLATIEPGDNHINGVQLDALEALLKPLAREQEGGKLIDFCDSLAAVYQDTALVRAHKAIGLSRVGRVDEASEIMNIYRDVIQIPFEPPSEYESIEQFNRVLSDEILAQPVPDNVSRDGIAFYTNPNNYSSPALQKLRAFVRAAIVEYIAQCARRGNAMPSPPEYGYLGGASVVLRGDAKNGEHIHGHSYVSSVYHALVPDCVVEAPNEQGALVLGPCEQYTGGHIPCWGTRYIKPVAGSLVVFPAHVFHDVVPTHTDEPRISIVMDLMPKLSGASEMWEGWKVLE